MKITEGLERLEKLVSDNAPRGDILNLISTLHDFAEAQENAQPQPPTPEEKLILEKLNTAADYVKQDDIGRELRIEVGRVIWILEGLRQRGYLVFGNPDRYRIEQKGRDFLYKSP